MKHFRESESENIIFFDGVCSLCSGFIDFLIKRDSKKILRYAPLQGHTAVERLPLSRVKATAIDGPNYTSVVYLRDGVMYIQSNAVLEIFNDIGGLWRLASIFKLVPRSVRDAVYNFVATHRYQWFGRRETCRLPSKEERKLFLD